MEKTKKFATKFMKLLESDGTIDLSTGGDTENIDSDIFSNDLKPDDEAMLNNELQTVKTDADAVGNKNTDELMKELGEKYAKELEKIIGKVANIHNKVVTKKEFGEFVSFEPSDIIKKLNDLKINLTTGLVEELEKKRKKESSSKPSM